MTSPGRFRAMTALLLLGPGTPMLFQGEEFGATQPFLYFADHKPELSQLVHAGRIKFLQQFHSIKTKEGTQLLEAPDNPNTFKQCILDFSERQTNSEIYQLHKDLIRLRREHPAFRAQKYRGIDGAILGPEAFVLRYFADDAMDTILLINFGLDLHCDPAPEPLLAPPRYCNWQIVWSSENPAYGGTGTPPLDTPENWWIPGHAAVVLVGKKAGQNDV